MIRRSGQGWRVADEEAPDLTSAIVLADLLAPGLRPPDAPDAPGAPADAGPDGDGEDGLAGEARRLRVTVAQLQHALATRVRVEQAIGVLAERGRIAPKAAFELLRGVARGSGARLVDLAEQVVESAANPLLALPDELARPPRQPRVRGRSPRHVRVVE
ncbi:MAG TPA: ANTAR domain-containing protein [Streptosporangiaceae bacterium]